MSTFEKNMEKIFEVTPTVESPLPIIPQKIIPSNNLDLENDLGDAYRQSKDNLQDIIDEGREAMDEILRIAKESEHPRAFEVYGTLLKNVVDANEKLLTIQKQMRDMDKGKQGPTNIDKAIFVGSTAELGKLLKANSK